MKKIISIILLTTLFFITYAEKKDQTPITREELAVVFQDTFNLKDTEELTIDDQEFLKEKVSEAMYVLESYKKRLNTAKIKQEKNKKDFFSFLKKNPALVGRDFDMTLTAKLDYNSFDYDNNLKNTFKGFRTIAYLDMRWMPNFDTEIYLEFFFNDIDWDTTSGNDPIRTDLIKQAYIKIDYLTAGHFPITLGGGSLLDARVDGIMYKNEHYTYFLLEEGGAGSTSPDDAFNTFGISYDINQDLTVYIASISFTGQTKRIPLGLFYEKEFCEDHSVSGEFLFHKYDENVTLSSDPTKTDDLFTNFSLSYTWKNKASLCYTKMKEGRTGSIGRDGLLIEDDLDLTGSLFTDLGYDGNVEDLYFKYDHSLDNCDISFIYEAFKAADVAPGISNPALKIYTLAYSRPVSDNSVFDVYYSYISNNRLNTTGLLTDINNIYAPGLIAGGADEELLKFQLTYSF